MNLPAVPLAADCAQCVGLCCVAPAFVASADFAFSKPAGVACRHLDVDARCGIHDRLRPAGMPGCVAYDCFGAGQRVVGLLGGAGRSPRMLRAYEVVLQLHELLWYVTDALSRPAAAPVHAALNRAAAAIDTAVGAAVHTAADTAPDTAARTAVGAAVDAAAPGPADPAVHRATVAPLLRRASTLVRVPAGPHRRAADLAGRDLVGVDLRRADLSTAQLIGADLRGADLRCADLLRADLRGADLGDADMTGALYLTRTQVGGARGSPGTQLPDRLPRPAYWS